MGRLLICTGRYAETPYYVNSVCMNVYSVEELCYLFALNPFIITNDFMDNSLISWLRNECDLGKLADSLAAMLKKGCTLGEFIDRILDYVNYCDRDERLIIDETIKSNSGLSDFERRKHQADYLLRNYMFEAAVEEYETLLEVLPDVEAGLKPVIFHNMGYAYANLFMFDIAAKYFKRSYDMTGLIDTGLQYLASLRMYMSEEKYLSFIANNSVYHDASLALESQMNKAIGRFEASRENTMLSALQIYKDEGNVASYYEQIDKVILRLKDDYLKMVTD
ncbi:MAG: hypothetical protein K5888_00900 [Lachnospiraceae bacterium]|nr:hypothetical protein [Lachnospiraceae bacterium]